MNFLSAFFVSQIALHLIRTLRTKPDKLLADSLSVDSKHEVEVQLCTGKTILAGKAAAQEEESVGSLILAFFNLHVKVYFCKILNPKYLMALQSDGVCTSVSGEQFGTEASATECVFKG